MDIVGNYSIIRELKMDGPGGGMSKLYVAYRRGPAELQGLQPKVLLKRQALTSPELIDMFLTEARLGLKLVHPNIARVTDVFKDAEHLWLAMEFIEGVNVHQIWAADRERVLNGGSPRLTLDMMAWIVMQAAEALDFAHELPIDGAHARIVHRDVTPDNLMVSGLGSVFVIDFGIALADVEWRQGTEGHIVKGKSGYLSPEVLHGDRADRRADVYGLGIVLTELLTGEKAFPQETRDAKLVQIMLGDLPPIRSKNPDVPPDLAQFVEQMRNVERDKRIQTARDVYDGLYRLRPSSAAPDVKRQLGALAVEMSAPRRTKSSPFYRAPVRTLALPTVDVDIDVDDKAPPVIAAPAETNAPQYVEPKLSVIDAETHKVANNQLVSLVLAPSPPAPMVLVRNANDVTHQDRRDLHRRPTVMLPERRELAAHIDRATSRAGRKSRAVVAATLLCFVVALVVVGGLRFVAGQAASVAKRKTAEQPKAVVDPQQQALVTPPAVVVVSTTDSVPPIHHHRKKTAAALVLPEASSARTTLVSATKMLDESRASVGVISVPANDREVRYVFVDEVNIGKAPRDYEVAPGRHHVVVTAIDKGGVPVQRFAETVVVKGGDHRLVGAR